MNSSSIVGFWLVLVWTLGLAHVLPTTISSYGQLHNHVWQILFHQKCHSFCLLQHFFSLLCDDIWTLWGRWVRLVYHLEMSTPQSLSFFACWPIVVINIYYEEIFRWGLKDVLIYSYKGMNLGGSLLLCPFRKTIVLGSSLVPMT